MSGLMAAPEGLGSIMRITASLARDQRGSVAMVFALSLSAIVAGVGAALDYSRLSNARTGLQSALDAALLIAGKQALATGQRAERGAVIAAMKGNLPDDLKPFADTVQIEQTDSKLSGRVSGTLTNRFGSFVGMTQSAIDAAASVPLGGSRLELAMVLDTTGSMGQLNKLSVMKTAAIELVDAISANRQAGTEIAIGVVPFATQVRVSPANAAAPWLELRKGQAVPKENTDAATWDGCIMDRDKPFNEKRGKPAGGRSQEAHPAQNCAYPRLQTILPLTTDMNQVKFKIYQLEAEGNTNTTIGMAWGLNLLDPEAPLGGSAVSASRKPVRVMIFLTDGLNTEDRFTKSSSQMDASMRELCRTSKDAGIRVFTVRVIEGNDGLLRDCASDPADFYTTNDSAGLVGVFRSITQKLTTLRLSS